MDQYTSMDGFVIIHNNEVVMKCSYNNENYFNHYRFNIVNKDNHHLKHVSFSIHDIIFTNVITGYEIQGDKLFIEVESIKKGCYNKEICEVRDETNDSNNNNN